MVWPGQPGQLLVRPTTLRSPQQIFGTSIYQLIDLRYGVGVGYELNGLDLSKLIDLGTRGNHELQGTASLQPPLGAGGPGGTPEAAIATSSQYLECTLATPIAIGNRPSTFVLARTSAATSWPWRVIAPGNPLMSIWHKPAGWHWYFDLGAEQGTITVPPSDIGVYHVFDMGFQAGGWVVNVDGVAVTPQPISSGTTLRPGTVTTTGYVTQSGGGVAWKLLLDRMPTASERFETHAWLNYSKVNSLSFGLSLPTS